MNSFGGTSAAETAAQLLARPRGNARPPLPAGILQELRAWSASEAHREDFCRRLNEARLEVGSTKAHLLELVRDEQLAPAVSIHASNHGEIIVREVASELFAIFVAAAN
jgi:hypothetical protein